MEASLSHFNKEYPAFAKLGGWLRSWKFFPRDTSAAQNEGTEAVAAPTEGTETLAKKASRFGIRILQAMALVVGITMGFGPLSDHFAGIVRTDVLGPAYAEAKAKSGAVSRASDFRILKEKSAELKIWADKSGKEYLALKSGGKTEDVHALTHASILLDSGIEEFNRGTQDEHFTAYKLRKAAADFPTHAFMKEKTSLEGAKTLWILALAVTLALMTSVMSYLGNLLLESPARSDSKSALVGGFLGGFVGGGIVAIAYVRLFAIGTLLGA